MESERLAKKKTSKKRSLSLRIQRTTVEYSYVQIPLTDDMLVFDANGTGQVNTERAFERGLELAQEENLVWFYESEQVLPHPWQRLPDTEERVLLDHTSDSD